jgi:signal transduction histidine kinase
MELRIAAAFIAGYVLLDWVSYIHPLQQSSITPWNPQPALAIALLALYGQRYIPVVFAGVLAADLVVRHASGWPAVLLVPLVLTLGYAAMAAALATFIPLRSGIATRSDMGHLLAVVTLGSLVTGGLYVGALWSSGAMLPGPYFEALLQFWIGDCVGILVTLPILFMLHDPPRRAELSAIVRHPLAWIQFCSVVAALWLVFSPIFSEPFKFFYVLFLPLVWIAVRFGLAGAALAMLTIQGGVIVATQWTAFPSLTVFELQALLIALTVTGLFLGIIVDERRRASEELRNSLRLAAAGEMSAALAHELNQPLTALSNYARAGALLAAAPVLDRDLIEQTLQKVLAEAQRAADVVRRLRDFFRTGSTVLQPASLPGIAQAVVLALQPRAESLGVSPRAEHRRRHTRGADRHAADRSRAAQPGHERHRCGGRRVNAAQRSRRDRPWQQRLCTRRGSRQRRRRIQPGRRSRLRAVLVIARQRNGDGAGDQPRDRRGAWRPAVGRDRRARRLRLHASGKPWLSARA